MDHLEFKIANPTVRTVVIAAIAIVRISVPNPTNNALPRHTRGSIGMLQTGTGARERILLTIPIQLDATKLRRQPLAFYSIRSCSLTRFLRLPAQVFDGHLGQSKHDISVAFPQRRLMDGDVDDKHDNHHNISVFCIICEANQSSFKVWY
jgi:hypothetical protein